MPEQQPDQNEPPESYAQARLAICRTCEHYKMFVCTQCGCFMPAKTRFKWTECPLKKWSKEP